jgi:hypothetical protein
LSKLTSMLGISDCRNNGSSRSSNCSHRGRNSSFVVVVVAVVEVVVVVIEIVFLW